MILLPHDCQLELRADVEHAYPMEACGILVGWREAGELRVARLEVCANVDPEPRKRYSIDPAALIAAQKKAREDGLEILGFYHSHPDHPAEPSPSDLREAQWTGCVYMICAVERGRLAAIGAMRLEREGEWVREQVQFEPPER